MATSWKASAVEIERVRLTRKLLETPSNQARYPRPQCCARDVHSRARFFIYFESETRSISRLPGFDLRLPVYDVIFVNLLEGIAAANNQWHTAVRGVCRQIYQRCCCRHVHDCRYIEKKIEQLIRHTRNGPSVFALSASNGFT